METQPQPPAAPKDLPAQAYRYLMHTLLALLPPPIEDTPQATLTRNHAAIARIAALAPSTPTKPNSPPSASPPGRKPKTCSA